MFNGREKLCRAKNRLLLEFYGRFYLLYWNERTEILAFAVKLNKGNEMLTLEAKN